MVKSLSTSSGWAREMRTREIMMERFVRGKTRRQKIQRHHTRRQSTLGAALICGAALVVSGVAHAGPPQIATSPAPVARPSVAGEPPASAIATPDKELPERIEPDSEKTAATRPKPASAAADRPAATTSPKISAKASTQNTITEKAATKLTPERAAADAREEAVRTAAEAKAREEMLLLAQLEADLKSTESRLDTTNQKLSAGQKELMGLSNTLKTVMSQQGADAAGLHPFVRIASRYMGTPYVWGGESRYGFDCSGFIIRVMRDLGYKALPHSAAEQFKYGRPIAQPLLKPGDIVFFANTYKPGISHVGIYIGKRRFIHAASTRQGTIISSLDASPYKQKYAGARRLMAVGKRS